MRSVDPNFPVFVLVGLLVGETYYQKTLVPRIKNLKKKHLGDESVILHSYEIRRCQGAFVHLRHSESAKQAFYEALNVLFTRSRIRLYAIGIDKRRLLTHSLIPLNPYHVSLSQLLSIVCGPPQQVGASRPTVARIIAESRGKVEDKQLQHEYQGLRLGGLWNYGASGVQDRRPGTVRKLFPEKVTFVRKAVGVGGLELADLAAYPIARAYMSGEWGSPRSTTVISAKLRGWVAFP